MFRASQHLLIQNFNMRCLAPNSHAVVVCRLPAIQHHNINVISGFAGNALNALQANSATSGDQG